VQRRSLKNFKAVRLSDWSCL